MRARMPYPSTWKIWHPRNGISFSPPQIQDAPAQQRPPYPDLTGHRSLCSVNASSSEALSAPASLHPTHLADLKADERPKTAPPVVQAAVKPTTAPPTGAQEASEAAEPDTADSRGEDASDIPPHTPLDFKADEDLFRATRRATPGSSASYWSYTMYRGPEGEKVKVHYCKSNQTTERVCQHFLDEKVIGFDLEWLADANKNSGARRNVCLVQLASQSRVALFHIALYPKDDSLVAPTLQRLMEDPEVLKVGVNILADCTRLRKWLGIDSKGLFELSHLYRLVKYSASGETGLINRRPVQLAAQVKAVLGLPMFKGEDVRSSDWSRPLRMDQIIYSSSDAYAATHIYHMLEEQREALDPTPPRPHHAELGLPIRLADGDASTAVEEQDAQEADLAEASSEDLAESESEAAPTSSATDSGAHVARSSSVKDARMEYSTPQSLDRDPSDPAGEDASAPSQPLQSTTPKPLSRSKPDAPRPAKDERVAAAEDWLAQYRTARATPPRAPAAALRAYHLWSRNSELGPAAVASLLRQPPLQTSTVTSYILEAIRMEKLPFEHARLRHEVLAQVPAHLLASKYAALEEETKALAAAAEE